MSIGLHNIGPFRGSKKRKKRVGRGLGSTGTTAGRGQKGQKARSGTGGFKRLGMRKFLLATPKVRGFKSMHPKNAIVSIEQIATHFGKGEIVTPKAMKAKGLVQSVKNGVKILSDGEIKHAITVRNCSVSKSAAEKILAAGGEIIA